MNLSTAYVSSVDHKLYCAKHHEMTYSQGINVYAKEDGVGFSCDNCKANTGYEDEYWHCSTCGFYDICSICSTHFHALASIRSLERPMLRPMPRPTRPTVFRLIGSIRLKPRKKRAVKAPLKFGRCKIVKCVL